MGSRMSASDDFDLSDPDVLHEVVMEGGTVLFESFDKDEAEEYLKGLVHHFGSIAKIKSTPV